MILMWGLLPFLVLGGTVWRYRWERRLWRESTVKDYLESAKKDPNNPKWPATLGFLFECRLFRSSGEARAESARMSLAYYERWYNLTNITNDYSRLPALIRVAFEAGDLKKAKRYAEKLLELAEQHKDPPWGNAIHYANTALGRLALRSGDVEQAELYLIRAGQTPGSPQLDSYGPSSALAWELLESGKRDVVLNYFDVCSRFWKRGRKKLELWSIQVRSGQVPDFGSNLTR